MAFIAANLIPGSASAFGLDDVTAIARSLAEKRYEAPHENLPAELREIGYDGYRDIRFRNEKSLWQSEKLPFEVRFFHAGLNFRYPVRINVVEAGQAKPLRFDHRDFHYGKNTFDSSKFGDVGFAGFRVHYPINTPEYKDEVAVFLGKSYFRAVGKGQRYGLSARGLAIDSGEDVDEEFPDFREFWLERPSADAKQFVVYALLDSKRVTGAYKFAIYPGESTHIDVQANIFQREKGGKIGIAPMTSMFFFGENQPATSVDYRPEVHDSDGLLIRTEHDEWVWRPLVNSKRLWVSSFGMHNPRGFGLMQRDRDFQNYQDLEARYELRPSAWVTPKGDWKHGRVEIVMLHTPNETHDNVVAFWVPREMAEPGQMMSFEYRLSWQHNQLAEPPHSAVVQSRRGHGLRKQVDDSELFMIDFEGPALKKLKPGTPVESLVWVGDTGELLEHQVFANDAAGGWRVSLRMRRKVNQPVEIRVGLRSEGKSISETWSYLLLPQ
jgi:glucans biosynthesis protein